MARKWTIWHRGGQNGRDGGTGTEIAIFKVKTFKSDLLRRERQSTIKLLRNKCSCCAPSSPQGLEILWDPIKRRFSYRPQTTQDCLTRGFGIKQDDEARKFRRLNYDTCNVS